MSSARHMLNEDPYKRKRKERIDNEPYKLGHSRAVPYLDWWALADSADIVVRRHAGCIPQASTFSTTARAWGLDVERAARRARPDFDGLV